jgi:hypothetical protein
LQNALQSHRIRAVNRPLSNAITSWRLATLSEMAIPQPERLTFRLINQADEEKEVSVING